MTTRRLMIPWALSTVFSVFAAGARGDDRTIVIREDSLLQRMALSPDGKVVATVGVTHDGKNFNSTVKLRDGKSGQLIRAFDEPKRNHLELAFSQEFLAIAVNGTMEEGPYELRLHDAQSGELRQTIDDSLVPGVQGWTALAFSSDGRRLAAAGFRNDAQAFMKLWHIDKGRLIPRDVELELPQAPQGEEVIPAAYALVFSPDGRMIAVGGTEAKIRLFSGVSGEPKATLDCDEPRPSVFGSGGIAFAPDSRTLACAGFVHTVRIWDVTARNVRKSLKANDNPVLTVAFSPDGNHLATGGRPSLANPTADVLVWDLRSGEHKRILADLAQPVNALAYSPDGKTLLVCAGSMSRDATGWKTTGELRLVTLE